MDLFDCTETLPPQVRNVIEWFDHLDTRRGAGFRDCELLCGYLRRYGYECDYGLDAIPYGLTLIAAN